MIVSENLQIKNMVKNHHLAKAISDVSWYELTRQLEYKAKWNINAEKNILTEGLRQIA